jgi:anti-sigma factor RsiW
MSLRRRHWCERAREWASLRVDGELSEFETRLLDRHLARCPDCAAFAADVTGYATLVRGAPLAPFRTSLTLPRRRRVSLRPRPLAAAALVAAAAVAVASFELGTRTQPSVQPPRVVPPATPDDVVGASIARRAKLLADSPHFWVGPRGFQLT